MDPTIKEPHQPSFVYKFKLFVEKVTKVIWYLIIAIIIIQLVLVIIKFVATPPNERMCWDRWICYNYCELAKQKVCIAPEKRDMNTAEQAWKLLLTGKRNIIEVLNDNQRYCACEITIQGETRLETFYKFYSEY